VTPQCENVHAFADGQLDPDAHHSFEDHLVGCSQCARELDAILLLAACADELHAEESARARIVPVNAAGRWSTWRKLRRWWQVSVTPTWRWAAGLTVAAAMAAAVLMVVAASPSPDQALVADLQARPYRATEARLSAGPFQAYRPLSGERGQEQRLVDAMTDRQQALAALESRGDYHLLGVIYLFGQQFQRSQRMLALAAQGPEVWDDQAALSYQQGHWEEALAWSERARGAAPGDGAALWNRALALQALGRLAEAARAFEDCAARNEVGWSAEATLRASVLRAKLAPREDRRGKP
jgi:hypothetical protein